MTIPVAEARLLEAATRRLRDSHGRPIPVAIRKLAGEQNINARQTRRALRRLAAVGLVNVTDHGGVVVLAPPDQDTTP